MNTNVLSGQESCPRLGRAERIFIFLALAGFCFFGVFDHSLWSANDSREGAMILEMRRAQRWLTPVFNGKPYLEKPPLLHWTALALIRISGIVTEGMVRLPAALFGFLTLLIIWEWAAATGRERGGAAGCFMCASSALYAEYSRVVLTDAALTFMVVLSLRLFWSAFTARRFRKTRMAAFMFAAAASFYAKGLIGPGLVWSSVCCFLVLEREWKLLWRLPVLFLPVFAAVLAPWAAALWKEGGTEYIKTVFWANQFGRFLSFADPNLPMDPYFVHKEPVYFYLLSLPLRLAPWTLLAAPALVEWFRPRSAFQGAMERFFKVSLAAMALVLHLSSSKAACYALPLFPFIFLMTGAWLEQPAKWGAAAAALARATFSVLFAAAALLPLFFLAMAAVPSRHGEMLLSPLNNAELTVCFGLAALAPVAALLFIRQMKREWHGGAGTEALLKAPAVLAALMVLNAAVFIRVYDHQRSYIPFIAAVRQTLPLGAALGIAGGMEKEAGAFMFYLNRRIDVVPCGDGGPTKYFAERRGPAGLIVPARHAAAVAKELRSPEYRIVKSSYPGYKSQSFFLFTRSHDEHTDNKR